MPTYQLTLAHDVAVYGSVDIEADNLAAAVEKVRADLQLRDQPRWSDVYDVDWDTSCGFRVVDAYELGEDGMSDAPLVRNIALSDSNESTPYTSEQVLVALTTARLTQE